MRIVCTSKDVAENLIAYPDSTSINHSQVLCPPVYKLNLFLTMMIKSLAKLLLLKSVPEGLRQLFFHSPIKLWAYSLVICSTLTKDVVVYS